MQPALDIVILYGADWDSPTQLSKHHLARHWAKSNRVLYVESPPNLLSFLARRQQAFNSLQRSRRKPEEVAQNLWVHSYLWPVPFRGETAITSTRFVNDFNHWTMLPAFNRTLNRLGFRQPVLFAGLAHALPIVRHISHRLAIYYLSDDLGLVKSFPHSYGKLELEFAKRCDLVITVTEELRRAKAHLNPKVFTVRNGADVDHFARTQAPETPVAPELQGLPRPIVGYVGSLFQWLDQDMISYAARIHPEWSFVLVGPITADVTQLRGLPNIHLLGPRPYAELPSYLKGFSVATVPFVFDNLTRRASPIKFYEYLASGIPVVASRLPDFEPFAKLSGLVSTNDEFVRALEVAISQETAAKQQERMTEARNHSWEARFAQVDSLIQEALAQKEALAPGVAKGHR